MQPDDDLLHILSHHPVTDDKLGFEAYAVAIRDVLASATAQNTGLTIGVFGGWGTGKSTIIKMVEEQLLQSDSQSGNPARRVWDRIVRIVNQRRQPLVINFDAWHYGHEQIWIGFLRCITRTIEEELGFFELPITWLRLWWRRLDLKRILYRCLEFVVRLLLFVGILVLALELVRRGMAGVQAPNAVPSWLYSLFAVSPPTASTTTPVTPEQWNEHLRGLLALVTGTVTLLATLWATTTKGARFFWRLLSERPSLPHDILRPTLDQSLPHAVELFRRELSEWIQVVGWQRPIVVLIDDLDRAPIDQIIPVLEAIKHFSVEPDEGQRDDPNQKFIPIAFVLAADRELIQLAIASHYEDFWERLEKEEVDPDRLAREYLEKIVQIRFELPLLSSAKLDRLLDEDRPTVTPIEGSAAWARQEARQVFTEGARENPRNVIQAFNTFQALWRVVRQRGLVDNIKPRLLASLLMIRYIWPDTFQRLFRYPDLFFDLHVLATGTPNEWCCQSEFEELLILGCPGQPTPLNPSRADVTLHKYPGLLDLLALADPPADLAPGTLARYLTLVEDASTPIVDQRIDPGSILMSGDPSLIKYARRVRGLRPEHLLHLIGFVEERILSIESKRAASQPDDAVARAVFALGRLDHLWAVDPLYRLIAVGNEEAPQLANRAIFALLHLANRGNRDTRASEVSAAATAGLGKLYQVVPHRFAHNILGLPAAFADSTAETRRAIVAVALHDELPPLRERAAAVVQSVMSAGKDDDPEKGAWLVDALAALDDPSYHGQDALAAFLNLLASLPRKVPVPQSVRDHLVSLALRADPPPALWTTLVRLQNSNTAFALLVEIVSRASHDSIQSDALKQVATIQRNPQIDWSDRTWKSIEAIFKEQPLSLDVWGEYLQALEQSERPEALAFLARAWESSPFGPNVRQRIEEALGRLAERGAPSGLSAVQRRLAEIAAGAELADPDLDLARHEEFRQALYEQITSVPDVQQALWLHSELFALTTDKSLRANYLDQMERLQKGLPDTWLTDVWKKVDLAAANDPSLRERVATIVRRAQPV